MTDPTGLPSLPGLTSLRALDHPELVAAPVAAALAVWAPAASVAVVEIDPDLADTAALTTAYDIPLTMSANCVVVIGRREGQERIAACLIRADSRADVNGFVKRALDVRKATFHTMERAVAETAMEYGGINPIGLPADWRLLIDARVVSEAVVLIGSGVRRSKLIVPGPSLAELPRAEVTDQLALAPA